MKRPLIIIIIIIIFIIIIIIIIITYASYSKLFKELKYGIEILVGKAVFKLWIKTVKMLFGSVTQLLGLLMLFWVPWTIYYKMHISFFKKMLIILR